MGNTGPEFEQKVRQLARHIFSAAPGDGGPTLVDSRERDCIIDSGDIIYYIECTISRTLDKVKSDGPKMVKYREDMTRRGRLVKLLYVTSEEPTGEQAKHLKQNGIEAYSYKQLFKKLIDSDKYIRCRRQYRFGSAADPITENQDIDLIKFLPVGIRIYNTRQLNRIKNLVEYLLDRKEVVLLGDYGMGKSLHIAEVFKALSTKHLQDPIANPLPIAINIREHFGQENPAEAIIRHCNLLGFDNYNSLIRAVNSGHVILLVDGFDETGATPSIRMSTDRMRLLRRSAVKLIRNFVQMARGKSGILIAGRLSFFDDINELKNSLETSPEAIVYELDEFNDQEIKTFLKLYDYENVLPDWVPRRPLLLSYLIRKKITLNPEEAEVYNNPEASWDVLIDAICRRESQIYDLLDGTGIRQILELIASESRIDSSPNGRVSEAQIENAFKQVVGVEPDAAQKPLLQRLPGLTSKDQIDGNRAFMDEIMLDVLRSASVLSFMVHPFVDPQATNWRVGLKEFGIRRVARKFFDDDIQARTSLGIVACKEALERWNSSTLSLDIIQILDATDLSGISLDFGGMEISEGYIHLLNLDDGNSLSNLRLSYITIDHLVMPTEEPSNLVLDGCVIGNIVGCQGQTDLPNWIRSSDIGTWDQQKTTNQIIRDEKVAIGARIALAIIRKVYKQKGQGRRENALFRGMPDVDRTQIVRVLDLMVRAKLLIKSTIYSMPIYYANSQVRGYVNELYDSNLQSDQSFLRKIVP